MEAASLKFTVQGPGDTFFGATDAVVEQITPNWVRFTTEEGILQTLAAELGDAVSEDTRIVMFIYLHPMEPPIRTIGRINWPEQLPPSQGETTSLLVQFQDIAPEDGERIRKYLRYQAGDKNGAEARTGFIRRRSDFFFQEVARMMEILANMSEGKREEFGEQFANLVGVKNTLGRRLEDKKLGDAICYHIERLASNIARLVGPKAGLRQVRIRKVTGKEDGAVEKDKIFVGWEEAPPEVGRSYCLYIIAGGIFRSAAVTRVMKGHFRTRNSLYELQEV